MVRSAKSQQSIGWLYSLTDVNWEEVGQGCPTLRVLVLVGRDSYLGEISGVLCNNPGLINQDYCTMFIGISDFGKSTYLRITIFRMVA